MFFILFQLMTQLSEKEKHSSRLEERIRTLEQRLTQGNQSGGDRVASLEKQVISLYMTVR